MEKDELKIKVEDLEKKLNEFRKDSKKKVFPVIVI